MKLKIKHVLLYIGLLFHNLNNNKFDNTMLLVSTLEYFFNSVKTDISKVRQVFSVLLGYFLAFLAFVI